jgi:hypothetical protein
MILWSESRILELEKDIQARRLYYNGSSLRAQWDPLWCVCPGCSYPEPHEIRCAFGGP